MSSLKKLFTYSFGIFVLLSQNSAHALPKGFDPEWIKNHSTRSQELILKRIEKIEDMQNLEPSIVFTESDISGMNGYEKQVVTKRFKASINDLWSVLVNTPPNQIWTGPHVNFAFGYSKRDQRFYPNDENTPPFHEGLISLNVLDIFGPKVAVAVEVVVIDRFKHSVQLAYSKGGATDGTQIIELKRDGNSTLLVHTSYYKGESKFRSRMLYPFFHKMMLNEYYSKIDSLLKSSTH